MPEKCHTKRLDAQERLRIVFQHEQGDVRRFLVKLEHREHRGTWEPVARYDHNPMGGGHDLHAEGVHIDVCFEDGSEKKLHYPDDYPVSRDTGEVMSHCILMLEANYSQLMKLYAGDIDPEGFSVMTLIRGLWNSR